MDRDDALARAAFESNASFAAQVHHGELEWPREARFGAGRPRD